MKFGWYSDMNWVLTAPRAVADIPDDFSPNQFYYMITEAIN
jgi:hypothetical protein